MFGRLYLVVDERRHGEEVEDAAAVAPRVGVAVFGLALVYQARGQTCSKQAKQSLLGQWECKKNPTNNVRPGLVLGSVGVSDEPKNPVHAKGDLPRTLLVASP